MFVHSISFVGHERLTGSNLLWPSSHNKNALEGCIQRSHNTLYRCLLCWNNKPTQQKDLDLVFIIEINKLEYSFKFSRFQFRRGNEGRHTLLKVPY